MSKNEDAPGKDAPSNFMPLAIVVESFFEKTREEFFENYPDGFVLVDNPGGEAENASFHTIGIKAGDKGGTDDKSRLLEHLGTTRWVFALRKEKKKFATMVTIGRAANNDMRLNVPSVSKFHAYFQNMARDNAWYLADANSSNGTFLDGNELPPSHGKVALNDGCLLRFGPDVTAQYYSSQGFWQKLCDRLGDTPQRGTPKPPAQEAGADAS